MKLSELWRISTFRLTVVFGLIFAVGLAALLGVVYVQSNGFLTRRVDGILATEADGLARAPAAQRPARIDEALALSGAQTNVFALFGPDGRRIAGNLDAPPPALKLDGAPLEVPPMGGFPAHARLIARRMPSGEELVVGRDVNQLREMRAILASALVWGGVVTALVMAALATALSIGPMRRLRALQAAGEEIAAGNLKRRMPTSRNNDELDMFASTVNYMMDEVERLMLEVRGVTDTIAHDLRTPLTRARAQLHRLQSAAETDPAEIARVTLEIDAVLERFRALMRISELEARERRAGFEPTDLAGIVASVVELYQPLAEENGVRLLGRPGPSHLVQADPKLLFEAVSNLVDNAIKFTGPGGHVQVRLGDDPARPTITVQDDGPGVAEHERAAVLQRFYRGERDRLSPGSGLGLSIVAAIMRLHRFELTLRDANPGLEVEIACRNST